jgi:predicted DNA-binding WGR domain protein
MAEQISEQTIKYQHTTDGHNKFWNIEYHVSDHWGFTVHWGKIGTAGTFQTKLFSSEYLRNSAAGKLRNSKIDKGYELVSAVSAKKTDPKPVKAAQPVCETQAPKKKLETDDPFLDRLGDILDD